MNTKIRTTQLLIASLFLTTATAVGFEISRHTTLGGEMRSTSSSFELSGTIGQSDVGMSSSQNFTVDGGFWFEQRKGDCNYDNDINLADFGRLHECATGPEQGGIGDCLCLDHDGDGDVDMADMAQFWNAF